MYTEEELIKGCIKNSRIHQKALYERYSGKMYALCLRYARDDMQAEDFLQEGFVSVFTKMTQFNGSGSFEGWIRRIMVNNALQKLRRQRNSYTEVEIENSTEIATDEDVIAEMSAAEITTLIQKLPTGYRTVFNLYVIEEYSHKEIAEELGISEGTSKSQLARARQLLQKMIKKNENFQNKQPVEAGNPG